ncbi:DUF998 domain-containing protein [Pseudoxanthomonas suwonensis]|uniref:DUF998 domain-containing protein n=1 Tax=Pseudoxanthomonas suwonensis TaxID=314722 RepID=A0A0E3Z3B9_9GAMM|nr:DUF998 domain-containing protein [Pseudoxanthomonas suwonensis]AKC86658.1 hypothetical protein WQ53_07670 [Pseudoxanthomonas suwonensis]
MDSLDASGNRRLGTAILCLLVLFCLAALGVQASRPEYDWWQAPLSFYLAGPNSTWLRLGYYGLAGGSVLLAIGLYRTLAPAARYALVPALLVAGGAALAVTATWPGASPGHPVSDLGALVHGLSAIGAFLFVGTAMLLQSAALHRDPHWRPLAAWLLALATLAFGGLWLHALWKALPRGGSQKAVIALYLLWLGTAAWRLRSTPAAMAAEGGATGLEGSPT